MITINEEVLNGIIKRFEQRKEDVEQKKFIGKRSLNAFDALNINSSDEFIGFNRTLSKIFELLDDLKLKEDFKTHIYDEIVEVIKK